MFGAVAISNCDTSEDLMMRGERDEEQRSVPALSIAVMRFRATVQNVLTFYRPFIPFVFGELT